MKGKLFWPQDIPLSDMKKKYAGRERSSWALTSCLTILSTTRSDSQVFLSRQPLGQYGMSVGSSTRPGLMK